MKIILTNLKLINMNTLKKLKMSFAQKFHKIWHLQAIYCDMKIIYFTATAFSEHNL